MISLSINLLLLEASLKMPYRCRYDDTIPAFNMLARKNPLTIVSIYSPTDSFVGTH